MRLDRNKRYWRKRLRIISKDVSHSSKRVTIPPFKVPIPIHPTCSLLFKIFVFPPFFNIPTLLRHFMQFPPFQPPTVNHSSSSNTPIFLTPSHWRYLFPATNHSHLNSDQINQTNIVFRRVEILVRTF